MGRLASRLDQQGKGLGKLLMGCVVGRCLQACKPASPQAGGSIRVNCGCQKYPSKGVLRALRVHMLHGFADDSLFAAGLKAGLIPSWRKAVEALLSRKQLACTADCGNCFHVPPDERNLN